MKINQSDSSGTTLSSSSFNAEASQVADLIVSYLQQIGVEYVFGVPGGSIEPFYNALARQQRQGGKIQPVFVCHEATAAFMADGYSRYSGKLGVCVATSGPGASNLITGIACAYENHIPLLVITGQPPLPNFGKGALQESSGNGVDMVSMMHHCTRYNSLISHVSQTESKLVCAIMCAMHATKGPVHLSIPVDIHRQDVNSSAPQYDLAQLLHPRRSFFDQVSVKQLIFELEQATQPLFLIGEGAHGAIEAMMKLLMLTGASFFTTPNAKGLINANHSTYLGVFGFGGHSKAAKMLAETSKLVIAFGVDFGEFTSGGWSNSVLNTRLIHVDSVEDNFSRSPMAKLHVFGDIRTVCNQVGEHILDNNQIKLPVGPKHNERNILNLIDTEQIEKYHSDATPIKPQRLMHELSALFPAGTRFVADAGNSMVWAPHFLQVKNRRKIPERRRERNDYINERRSAYSNWLSLALNFAPMGWAIGAAIGGALAKPGQPIVCITGDGSFLMSGTGITTAVLLKVPIIYVILNDGVYGMVMHGQRLAGAEPIGFQLPTVNYKALAEAMNVLSYSINSIQDLEKLDIEKLCCHPGPVLLDVIIDSEEVPPMKMRLDALGSLPV